MYVQNELISPRMQNTGTLQLLAGRLIWYWKDRQWYSLLWWQCQSGFSRGTCYIAGHW